MALTELIKQLYFKITGYSYPNLGRLFIRLFVGVMLMQFGIRQMIRYDELQTLFPAVLGMSSDASLIVMIIIEIGCSLFIMIGFLTRLMVLPPFFAMILSEYNLLVHGMSDSIFSWTVPGYLPAMFLGFYFALLLMGPGKISIDYFLSLHLIHSEDKSEDELEVV